MSRRGSNHLQRPTKAEKKLKKKKMVANKVFFFHRLRHALKADGHN